MNYLEYLQDGNVVDKWYQKAKKFSLKDLFKKSEEQTSEGDNNNNSVYKKQSNIEKKINKSWQKDNYKNLTKGVPPGAVGNPTHKW